MPTKKDVQLANPADRGMSRWLIAKYNPTALFSLRMSHSTSSGGKTLFVPTPYSFKLALVDAAFRAGGRELAEIIFNIVKGREVRINPPSHLTVNHTFVKIKREPKTPTPEKPYISSIAFREYCFFRGQMQIALAVGGILEEDVEKIKLVMAHINYLGKRGSFIQFVGADCSDCLSKGFSLPVPEALENLDMNVYKVTQFLDDIGEVSSADLFERINTYAPAKIEINKHRIIKQTFLPYKLDCSSKNYSYYKNQAGS